MKTTVGNIRSLVREVVLTESLVSGDLLVFTDEESTTGIKYNPGSDDHGKSYNLPSTDAVFRSSSRGQKGPGSFDQLVVVQALGPTQHTQWGLKIPIYGFGGNVFFVDPNAVREAPEGSSVPGHRVNAAWWANHQSSMEQRARLKGLGLRRGAGRYGQSQWDIWEAPDDLKNSDAVEAAFREKSRGWPIWSVKTVRDPESKKWFVNYELDTSG